MSQPSDPSFISFKDLFDSALQEYENKTDIKLAEHSFAKELKVCEDVDSISVILQKQAQKFDRFKDDGKIMKSLRPIVDVLHTLFNSNIIGPVVSLIVHTNHLF